jgi:hypothetical protein
MALISVICVIMRIFFNSVVTWRSGVAVFQHENKQLFYLVYHIERRGRMVNTPDSYFGYPGIKSRPLDGLTLLFVILHGFHQYRHQML